MRRFIVLCLFLILSSTGISSAKNSKAKLDGDIAVENMIREMSKQYTDCSALFIDFRKKAYELNGHSFYYDDYDQRSKMASETATAFAEIIGDDPKAVSKNITKRAAAFVVQLEDANNNDKFLHLIARCRQITDDLEGYKQEMKAKYGFQ